MWKSQRQTLKTACKYIFKKYMRCKVILDLDFCCRIRIDQEMDPSTSTQREVGGSSDTT